MIQINFHIILILLSSIAFANLGYSCPFSRSNLHRDARGILSCNLGSRYCPVSEVRERARQSRSSIEDDSSVFFNHEQDLDSREVNEWEQRQTQMTDYRRAYELRRIIKILEELINNQDSSSTSLVEMSPVINFSNDDLESKINEAKELYSRYSCCARFFSYFICSC